MTIVHGLFITLVISSSKEAFSFVEYRDSHIFVGYEQELISWDFPLPIHLSLKHSDDDNAENEGEDDIAHFDEIVVVNDVY